MPLAHLARIIAAGSAAITVAAGIGPTSLSLALTAAEATAAETAPSETAPETAAPEASTSSLVDSPKAVLDEAWQIVNRDYVDPNFNQTDWQAMRERLLGRDYASLETAYAALKRALGTLDDPYTRFMDPQQYAELTSQTSGEFSGIGLQLQVHPVTGQLTVLMPLEESPAREAGIQAGDRILTIEGRSTEGMGVEGAARMIRGEAGTSVALEIERGGLGSGQQFEVSVARAILEVPAVTSALRLEQDAQVGYVYLSEFSAHAAEQMHQAIARLLDQGADAFVLDLRGNPGGLLQSSIDISRMWLDEGIIVQTVDRNGVSEDTYANDTALTDLPLAVLVDEKSASSSEILTGALQDNDRALVLGTKTFGKALVQAVHELADGSGLAVTVANYYTPKGTDISDRGITPSIELALTASQRRSLSTNPDQWGTSADPYYREAVTVLRPAILANGPQTELSRSLVD
ncbi:MAG: S41 family peptidase [Elainellaceae cyanobacterium]